MDNMIWDFDYNSKEEISLVDLITRNVEYIEYLASLPYWTWYPNFTDGIEYILDSEIIDDSEEKNAE